MKVIDVSEHNGLIAWNEVKASGINGAIIRAGYGRSGDDERFEDNILGAIGAGIKYIGVYWFSYAYTEDMATREAIYCNERIEKYKEWLNLGVFFDWEYDSMNYAKKFGVYPTKYLITEMNLIFCEEMEKFGYEAGYYLNWDYKLNYIDCSKLSKYRKWFAWYNLNLEEFDCFIWQYTSCGHVEGVPGNVDVNELLQLVPDLPDEPEEPQKEDEPTGSTTYIVQSGDTLSEIAQKFNTTVAKIAADNNIKNVDLIYPGQKLIINRPGSSSGSLDMKELYIVRYGDTLSEIAQRFNTTVEEIAAYNNIYDVNMIYAGQIIYV